MTDSRDKTDWLGLSGKVAVVTGAVGGVGRVLVQSFLDAGCAVALLDRDQAQCDEVAAPLRDAGAPVLGVGCDISDEASVAAAAGRIAAELGAADILVNNAAIVQPKPLLELSLADWNKLIAVNLSGFFLCSKSFGEQMKAKGGGAMVHVASLAAFMPQAYSGAYSMTKAGVRMLSQTLAVELGEYGIRSNVVAPAMMITPLSEAFYKDPELKAKREGMVPLRRIGRPQDIADAAIWLASDRAGYVSGEEILIDGGLQRNLMTLIPRPGFDRASQEKS